MAKHSQNQAAHRPYRKTFPDAVAVAADVGPYVPADLYILALQEDTNAEWLLTDTATPTWTQLGGGGGDVRRIDTFTASASQTVFALAQAPVDPSATAFSVNGVIYTYGTDYTVTGSTLTWLDAKFVMGAGDECLAIYTH